jgi:hypothetical protein
VPNFLVSLSLNEYFKYEEMMKMSEEKAVQYQVYQKNSQ